jgi:hypothetical protein
MQDMQPVSRSGVRTAAPIVRP